WRCAGRHNRRLRGGADLRGGGAGRDYLLRGGGGFAGGSGVLAQLVAATVTAVFHDPFVGWHFVADFVLIQFRYRASSRAVSGIPERVEWFVVVTERAVVGIALVDLGAHFFAAAGNADVGAAAGVDRFPDVFPFANRVADCMAVRLTTAVLT